MAGAPAAVLTADTKASGIVDEHVDAPERRERRLDGALNRRGGTSLVQRLGQKILKPGKFLGRRVVRGLARRRGAWEESPPARPPSSGTGRALIATVPLEKSHHQVRRVACPTRSC